jgi:AraC-like DNA-binding protein
MLLSVTSFFNTIILLGSVQGLIISILLFFSKKNRLPNRLLSGLIMLITLASLNLYGNYQNWFNSSLLRIIVDFLPMVMVMPFGPLIWLYVQSSLDPAFRVGKKEKLHFLPVIIDWIPSITVIIYCIGFLTKTVGSSKPWGAFIDNYNVYSDIPRWISVTLYVVLSARYLTEYKQRKNGILNGQFTHFRWLQQFIRAFMVFQLIWLVYLIPYVIPQYTDFMLNTFSWYPIYIPLAVLIYWLGIKGYLISHQEVVAEKKANGASTPLAPELIKQVIASLIKSMEQDKVYLNPGLNLAVLSEATGFSPKMISSILNQHLQKSFNDFVNSYRVNAVKEKMLLPETSNLTIAGIALECGFNSQATFQRTFKEITGQSPSEYRKTVITAS